MKPFAERIRDVAGLAPQGWTCCATLLAAAVLLIEPAGCRPTEISETRFQARAQTCYELPVTVDGGARRPEGCEEPESVTSPITAPMLPVAPPAMVVMGAADGGLLVGSDSGAASVSDGTAGGSTGGGSVVSSGPPCDATLIFAKPITQGGCQDPDTGGCHEAGDTGVKPDLVTAGVGARLFGGSSQLKPDDDCAVIEPASRTWIKPGVDRAGSFVWNKIISSEDNPPRCGKPMPDDAEPLSEEAKLCIGAWIEWIAAGGGAR